jgi:hypothetical protein
LSGKNHNSILFLTTLGVYLGLVLVGATPQVLAQAATVKQFTIREEIGARDDLDNKPGDESESAERAVQYYLEDIEEFLIALGDLSARGQFNVLSDTFDVTQTTLLPCVDGAKAERFSKVRFINSNELTNQALIRIINPMAYGYSLGDCVTSADGKTAKDSRFNVHLDDKELSVAIVVVRASDDHADSLARDLDAAKGLFKIQATPIRTAIIEHTLVRPIGEHTAIVTRLPRGSLPSLLVSKAQ